MRHRKNGAATETGGDCYEAEEDDEAASSIFFLEPTFVTKDGKVLKALTQNKVFYDDRGLPSLMVSCVEKIIQLL